MFTTKTESVNASATSAQRPSATMIAISAITSGISPATTAPKTSSRMMNAAGRPNSSSPDLRSCCERSLKSWSSVPSPVMTTLKPSCPSWRSTRLSSLSTSALRWTASRTAWPSREIPAGLMCATTPVARAFAWRPCTKSWKRMSVSNSRAGDRTTISSSTPFLSGGKRWAKIRSACSEAGLPVECPWVVRFPGRNSAEQASPSTIATSQAESVRHG